MVLNFGGQKNELWCDGGEERFVCQMVQESIQFAEQCLWFSTLVSKKTTLPVLLNALRKSGAGDVKIIKMTQGQKKVVLSLGLFRFKATTSMEKCTLDFSLSLFSSEDE